MAEIRRNDDGTVRWRGDDPRDVYAALAALGDEARECSIHDMDSAELAEPLPALPSPDDAESTRERKQKAYDAALEKLQARRVKLIREKPGTEYVLVNEATGEIEQRGFEKKSDATDAAKAAVERALEHAREQHERLLGENEAPADLAATALAEVYREAREEGEDLAPADALARAQERIDAGTDGGGATEPPSEILHEGEPVKLVAKKLDEIAA